MEWLLLGEGAMLYESSQVGVPKKEAALAVSESNSVYGRDTVRQLTECQQERDYLQVQVATYQDALDRLGQSSQLGNNPA